MVTYFYDDHLDTGQALLRQYYTIVGWAEALHREGVDVTVICRFKENSRLEINGVKYIFINDGLGTILKARKIPIRFLRKVAALQADIIHLHHFTLSVQTLLLRWLVKKNTVIVIQHHGGKTIRNWKMRVHNRLNNVADGYFFTTVEQGRDWFQNRKQHRKIMAVMEGGTFFNYDTRDLNRNNAYRDRTIARTKTGISGSPVFLWVGRLDDNKDPLTVLDGFEILLQQIPEATLYMIYDDKPLEVAVKKTIARSELLKKRVQLLGAVPHSEIETYYHGADYFVLGSHYEGSGYALSEALRCGCIPVITDIPSFRMMTDEGRLGALWQTDNKLSFVEAAKKAISKPIQAEGNYCINYYNHNLSFEAIARLALQYYRRMAKQ